MQTLLAFPSYGALPSHPFVEFTIFMLFCFDNRCDNGNNAHPSLARIKSLSDL